MPDTPQTGLRRHVRHVEVEAPDDLATGTRWRGVVVRTARAPELTLLARSGGVEEPVSWGLPSPRMRRRFPQGANAGAARFEVELPVARGPVELVVRAGDGREQVVTSSQPPVAEGGLAELAQVPVADRGTAWLRESVLALVTARRRPQLALEHLARLRDELAPDAFEGFWAQVDDLLSPLALTPSGYHPALGSIEPSTFFDELAALVAALEDEGHLVFLVSGTLLGAVREGRPLAHDYDADLAVLLPGDEPDVVVEGMWRLKDSMRDLGLLDEDYEHEQHHHLRVALTSGTPVDLFPAWVATEEDGGRLHVWPWTAGGLAADALLPLGRLDLARASLPVPHDPDAVLTCNYGSGWSRFDPTFSFDWATAREQHADYVRASRRRWEREAS